jgi:hypothetical protein
LLACYLSLEHLNFLLAYSVTRIAPCRDLEDYSFGHLGFEFENSGLNRYEFFRKQIFDDVFSVLVEINMFHYYYGYICSLILHARLCVRGATYLMTCQFNNYTRCLSCKLLYFKCVLYGQKEREDYKIMCPKFFIMTNLVIIHMKIIYSTNGLGKMVSFVNFKYIHYTYKPFTAGP